MVARWARSGIVRASGEDDPEAYRGLDSMEAYRGLDGVGACRGLDGVEVGFARLQVVCWFVE